MKRLFFFLSLALSALLWVHSCDFPEIQQVNTKQISQQTTKPSSKDATIAILSVNDMHSALDQMPKFAALADSLRQVYPDLLVFSAGDNRTGNPINDQYEPANYPMIALMNKVGFDLCAVGNHEWDGGVEALQKNIEDADFPFLCANVIVPKEVKLDVKPYVVLERQGLKIAVLGLIETRADGLPGAHPANFTQIRFKKALDVIPDYLFLKEQSDVFLLLSHLGYEEDLEVAERYPAFDAIIGGHTHTLVERPVKHNGVMVTQACSNLKYATLLVITIKKGVVADVQATTLSVKDVRKKNAEVKALLAGFNSDQSFNETLATATTNFETREEIGCMITDGIRKVSGADFAFTNTGGIRIDHLKKGPITVKDIYDMDPFTNDIVVYQMTGRQIERFIMESFKKNGRYPSYVSGMTYTVFTDQDNYPKSVSIKPDKGGYSKDAVYKVAMNSYMASTVRFESVDDGQSQYMTSEEMVIQYLRKQKTVSYKGVSRTDTKR